MFEAFRVGPVETKEGNFTLYAACSPTGAVSAVAPDDRSGLAELRKRVPDGLASCEPDLASAGQALGYRSAALSDEAKLARATFATMLVFGKTVEPRVVQQVPQMIEVAQRFLRERPWQIVRPEVPIEITIDLAGRDRRLAASVLGADGIEFGIALHESADALARFVALAEHDRHDEMRCVPVRSLTVGPEPAWVASAVKAAFGDPIVVIPTATDSNGRRVVTSEDLTELAAAMFAITKLGPGRLFAEVTVEAEDGGPCRATARITDREAVTSPPLPEWAAQPIRMTGDVPAAILTVPVLPVPDLAAVAAGLRALGFTVVETAEPRTATAMWPGMVLELVHAPSTRGTGCHVVVETVDTLVDVWRSSGIDVRIVENGPERIALVELPGGLSLTFGDQLPAGFQPATKRRKPRRRSASTH